MYVFNLIRLGIKMTNSNRLAIFGFGIFFLILILLIGYMIRPFISPIIFAGILAGIFYPLMEYIIKKTKFKRHWAASIVCFIIVLLILLPALYLIIELSHQAYTLYEESKSKFTQDTMNNMFFGDNYLAVALQEVFNKLDIDYNFKSFQSAIMDNAKKISLNVFEAFNGLISNIFAFLFNILIMMLVIFAILQEGPKLKKFMYDLSPLPSEDEELIVTKFNQMNYVTLVCNGLGGLLQGILAGLGFWITGISSSLLWSTFMVLLAFIPLVGISIVYIPASIYLLLTGKVIAGIILLIYCTLVALVVENWFKPMFMGKHIEINSILIFLSIIGGMSAFGMAGIFYGPLIIIIFLTFVQLYHSKYEPQDPSKKDKKILL